MNNLQLPRLVLVIALEVLLGLNGQGALVEGAAGGGNLLTGLAISCYWSFYFFHNVTLYL